LKQWENVNEDSGAKTARLRVEGGWIYRTVAFNTRSSAIAMVFVPDTRLKKGSDA